jgi:hypothetical protein
MAEEPIENEGNVTPLKPVVETPAERAAKIMAEKVPLRDVGSSLQRIAAELARGNALAAEQISLTQHQLGLTQRCIDLLAGQMNNGPQVQMAMLERFGTMFEPILDLMTRKETRPPQIRAEPVPHAPVEKTGDGYRVSGDPNAAELRDAD